MFWWGGCNAVGILFQESKRKWLKDRWIIHIWYQVALTGQFLNSVTIHPYHPSCPSLQRGKSFECPVYDTKQSDGEAPLMLKLWRMWSTPLLPLLPGPLCPGVIALDRVLSMGQIELNCMIWNRTVFTFKLCTYAKLNSLK